ncbi:LysR family transcriptional regulator [Emcibacter nanhaiensis]|uniref:LysR family transcriptional regulator n=1 Tax=Emcibacter nanhaiensis TaxID=1505037 RepID=A0A501PSH7_9PROT|nr:LysR family transcriptional regulator [Emcibacter nanhaiensis]TPD63205.1 LysR family transcriptional regulator [Emcibacter nanhaiensis]
MDLRQLRYFLAIVDEGSVRQASLRVNVSQPALTVAIQNLEDELQVKLFERTRRSLTPTREGFHLYQHARSILGQAEKIKADMASLKNLEKAEIKMAAPVTIASYTLTDPISSFMEIYPGLRLHLTQMAGPMVEGALLSGDIDIGFLSRPPGSAELVQTPLYKRTVRAFMRPGHSLAQEKGLTWRQLFEQELVTLPARYAMYDTIQKIAAHYRCSADITLTSDVVPLLSSTIRKSNVVGILLESVADVDTDLVSLPILDEDTGEEDRETIFQVRACYLKQAPLSLAADKLVTHLKAYFSGS